MKHFKNLDACITILLAVRARNDVEPGQKEYVELAINELRKLRRDPHAKQHQLHRSVRIVTEALAKAFLESLDS
jgi:hypothetical protein